MLLFSLQLTQISGSLKDTLLHPCPPPIRPVSPSTSWSKAQPTKDTLEKTWERLSVSSLSLPAPPSQPRPSQPSPAPKGPPPHSPAPHPAPALSSQPHLQLLSTLSTTEHPSQAVLLPFTLFAFNHIKIILCILF